MKDLRGRNAIVTGASTGLGSHVARALAREGMNVVLAARTVDALERVATELRGLGVRAIAVPTDVSDDAHLRRLVERALAEFGSIDVLVNNAGIEAVRLLHQIDPRDIRRTIDVNLTATLLLTRYVLPYMVRDGRGHVVNMSSIAGKHGTAYGTVYGATKAGMIAFTQSLRSEYHGTGISASVICPGFTSGGGIYDVGKHRAGRGAPRYVGTTTADAVAQAVVRSVRRDLPERIVNFPPLRPIFTICQAFPRIGEWIVRQATATFLKRWAMSDRWNRAGLEMRRINGKTIVVIADAEGAAAQKGMRDDDEVISVNGIPASDLSLAQIRRLWSEPDVDQLTISLEREQRRMDVVLELSME